MSAPRAALALAVALAIVALVVLLLVGGAENGSAPSIERDATTGAGPPLLRGSGGARTAPLGAGGERLFADASREMAAGRGPSDEAPYTLEVLDYRGAGVAGVEVFHEIDIRDAPEFHAGEKWKTLASGTTNAKGHVYLVVDPNRIRQEGEGANHRLRLVPPKEREDLSPTWRLWMPRTPDVYRMSQTHVVEGRVLDRDGEPVWAATVWIGDVPEGRHAVVNPDWMETRTDVDGRFRFTGIPTTPDWRIDVWAVGPGKERPASSRLVRGARNVALDDRGVELRLD